MAVTMSRVENRTGSASRSRLGKPIIGTRSAWAIAFADATPTRSPVNSPGPRSTATQLISDRSMRAWRRTKSIAGMSVSAWRFPRFECDCASTPSCPPMATPTCEVDVSMPRISMSPSRSPRRERLPDSALARVPGQPDRAQLDDAIVVAGAEGDPDLEEVRRQRRCDRVAPLDERHRALVEQLGQPHVEHLLHLLEAVHVDVVEQEPPPFVLAGEGERRARDGTLEPEAAPEALRERGLARAEVADEQHEVTRPRQLGQRG